MHGIPRAGTLTQQNAKANHKTDYTLGKTILALIIIEKSRLLLSTIVAYFYCKYKNRERNTFVIVVRALLLQLSTQSKDSNLLQVLYKASIDSKEEALESQVLYITLLTIALSTLKDTIHLVIDGLNKYDLLEKKKIISCITSILKDDKEPGRIRVLFISQLKAEIRSLLCKASIIRITESDSYNDITEYTR